MKALYQLKEEGIDEPLVYFEDFYEFNRERQTPDDKKLHKHNVLREFKGHKEGIKDLTHGKVVTTTSVSKCIFNHFDDYKICTEIGTDSIINVACVDTSMSKLSNVLTIILSCIEDIEPKDISKHVSRFLNTRHNVNVSKIVFLSQDSLPNYTQENNDIARFHLRDDIFLGKLA